jgi:hypothetical protein
MGLLSKLFWLALFCVFTFCLVVLFDHGPENFVENARKEFEELRKAYNSKIERKKDESDAAAR